MFCRIVVASDGSDHAQDALALALRLRDPDGGRLTLACATSAASQQPEDVAVMLAAGRARIPPGIRVAFRAPSAASPARALTELAERDQADLVVVGSSRGSREGPALVRPRSSATLMSCSMTRPRRRPKASTLAPWPSTEAPASRSPRRPRESSTCWSTARAPTARSSERCWAAWPKTDGARAASPSRPAPPRVCRRRRTRSNWRPES